MSFYYEDKTTLFTKILKALPYLYMPFITLEIYSIGRRILEYGVTPLRYVACMFVILQIVILLLTVIKKRTYLKYAFFVVAGLVFISTMTPLHLEAVSNRSQKNIIQKYFSRETSFDHLSQKDKVKVSSSYFYLSSRPEGEKYIPLYITQEDKIKMEKYDTGLQEYGETNRLLSYYDDSVEIEVTNYSKMIQVQMLEQSNGDTAIALKKNNEGAVIATIDIRTLLEDIMLKGYTEKSTEWFSYMKAHHKIKIDETTDFYISNFYFNYNVETETVIYFNIAGYLFIK